MLERRRYKYERDKQKKSERGMTIGLTNERNEKRIPEKGGKERCVRKDKERKKKDEQ
jgi:hypothetical protein